jgi:serine-type D-Ala-D-Ala carboxypeptidase (penicillin-binding protein 5/6)
MSFLRSIEENKKNYIFGTITIIFLVVLFNLLSIENKKNIINIVEEKIPTDYSEILNSIGAKSYFVYDIKNQKILFAKNEHEKLPLASITKLVTGFIVMDVLPETTIIDISKDAIMQEGDSGLIVGEKWKLKDLLDFCLITSSNDGIYAIVSAFNKYEEVNFMDAVKMMNEKVKNMGLLETVFINETGLDVDFQMSGAYSSASDISKIFETIIWKNPEMLLKTNRDIASFTSESGITHIAKNTNVAINNIPGIIASKTGFTDLAGGNLLIMFDTGIMHPIIVVVLGSTIDGRFSDIEKLANIATQKVSE